MEHLGDGGIVLETPAEIEAYRLLALKRALKLDLRGLSFKGGRVSAASSVKEVLIRNGRKPERNRGRLLQQYEDWLR